MIGQVRLREGEVESYPREVDVPRRAGVTDGAGSRDGAGAIDSIGRDVGIPAIGLAPWGAHFCEFYRDKQDLIETLVPFFARGLANNELCVWVTSDPLNADEAIDALGATVPDLDQRIASGQLLVRSCHEWFIQSGDFDPMWVLNELGGKLGAAIDQGLDGLRISGNAAWVTAGVWSDFIGYERTVNDLIRGQKILALCTYPLDGCRGSDVLDVVACHQFALVKSDEWMLLEPSERKMATEAVQAMNGLLRQRTEELDAALSDLRGFSAMVSHDLRNPLTSIIMLADDLIEHCRDIDSAEKKMLGQIHRNADRMQSLVVDVLDFAVAQRAEPMPHDLDMAALVRAAYDQMAAETAGRTVDLRVGVLPPAVGDPALITQVLANLIGNALKYSRQRAVTRIEIEADRNGAENAYHVRDNGNGFSMADADHLFTIFHRLPGVGQTEGTGVGLAIVKQIITRHGGRVFADSNPGHGATFTFTLPAARER